MKIHSFYCSHKKLESSSEGVADELRANYLTSWVRMSDTPDTLGNTHAKYCNISRSPVLGKNLVLLSLSYGNLPGLLLNLIMLTRYRYSFFNCSLSKPKVNKDHQYQFWSWLDMRSNYFMYLIFEIFWHQSPSNFPFDILWRKGEPLGHHIFLPLPNMKGILLPQPFIEFSCPEIN